MEKKIKIINDKKFILIETSENRSEYDVEELEKNKIRLEQDLIKINEILKEYYNAKSK